MKKKPFSRVMASANEVDVSSNDPAHQNPAGKLCVNLRK